MMKALPASCMFSLFSKDITLTLGLYFIAGQCWSGPFVVTCIASSHMMSTNRRAGHTGAQLRQYDIYRFTDECSVQLEEGVVVAR